MLLRAITGTTGLVWRSLARLPRWVKMTYGAGWLATATGFWFELRYLVGVEAVPAVLMGLALGAVWPASVAVLLFNLVRIRL